MGRFLASIGIQVIGVVIGLALLDPDVTSARMFAGVVVISLGANIGAQVGRRNQ
jgi:hypothetical protein